MAPHRSNTPGMNSEDQCCDFKVDRKVRKPLVEKKRRARINDSLQELRALVEDAELQSKMENAEVLEMTVKRVESVLHNRAQEVDAVTREACERFAAGYIQCMHEVHTFVSSCPGIEPGVAADLLNHLLESMPLNDEDRMQGMLADVVADRPGHGSTWSVSPDGSCGSSTPARSLSPAPSSPSADNLCSDPEETDSEQGGVSPPHGAESRDLSSLQYFMHPKSMWRPW